jgi:hypothetical protein
MRWIVGTGIKLWGSRICIHVILNLKNILFAKYYHHEMGRAHRDDKSTQILIGKPKEKRTTLKKYA